MSVSLIIPVLNEAESLGVLLTEVPLQVIDQLIVVDNGSTDQSGQVARNAGAIVISEPRRGYGFACAAGAQCATGDTLVFMDGDGSFMPCQIPDLVAPLEDGEADLVLGSRMINNSLPLGMTPHQRFGNHLFTWLLRLRFGLVLTDLGPFRAIRRELFHGLEMREYTYGWPLEMIVKTARQRKRILEIPITSRPRTAGQSKVSGTFSGTLLTAYRFSRVMFRYSF